jgi:hypothetical protein
MLSAFQLSKPASLDHNHQHITVTGKATATRGAFSKDLKSIVLWPGKTIARVKDTDTPSFANLPATAAPEMKNMRKFCSNHVEV